jgi:hypothetical protein
MSSPPEPGVQGGVVLLTLTFKNVDGVWVGRCDELRVSTFGKSYEGTREELIELVTLHLNGLEKARLLSRLFEDRGIVIHNEMPSGNLFASEGSGDRYVQPFQRAA